ncbi:tyrosine-type recombinase/integrase [Spirosoma sordidisoli]|uniref:Tyr recombinase domain-containing protein n=1 Tax=Spirosoma sordidisoli TaxID=2502893 RepID=A0A4Q2ULH9_9BACT|nr:tyrosine-type recombinase/integrase [Spirosoma sordidisoli]RYC70076.1 hypothetical protein EQG79_09400 [Spirosoma sordidisoli]
MEAQQEEKFLTIQETERVISYIHNPAHLVQVLLLVDAGLRVTEAIGLQWSDIDVRKKLVRVRSLKKRGKETYRLLPMSERLFAAVARLVEKKGRSGKYLFPGNGNDRPVTRASVNKWMRQLSDEHPDVPHLHPHRFRHTFATNLRANGAELADIRDLLGHEKLQTSTIYAHADRDRLRGLIEASTPRPTRWARLHRALRSTLFPATQARINLPAMLIPDLVGRDEEARRIQQLISNKVSVILVGPTGIGKSFLLESLSYPGKVLEIDDVSDFKKSIASALIHLLGSREAVAELLYKTTDADAVRAKVSKESLPSLCKLLTDCCDRKEYVLLINDIDRITPTVVKALEQLKDHFVIVTSARRIPLDKSSFLWNFEKIELTPLSRPDSLRLLHRLTADLAMNGTEWIQNKIWDTSAGNPRMITELAERIRQEPVIDSYVVDTICNEYLGRQTQEIDASPFLLLLFGGLIILKYVGRESGEDGLTFIGSAIMALLLFARYFVRGSKRKNL